MDRDVAIRIDGMLIGATGKSEWDSSLYEEQFVGRRIPRAGSFDRKIDGSLDGYFDTLVLKLPRHRAKGIDAANRAWGRWRRGGLTRGSRANESRAQVSLRSTRATLVFVANQSC